MKNLNVVLKNLIGLGLIIVITLSFYEKAYSQSTPSEYQTKCQFSKPALTFKKFDGLEFRLSDPFLSTQKNGNESNFALALELKNNSSEELTKLTFRVKISDKQGKVISESMNYCGPLTFEPSKGKTLPIGYLGIYERFVTEGKEFIETYGNIEIDLIEVVIAPKGLYDNPVFDSEWTTFNEFKGLEFRLSKPFKYLDDLSGSTYFSIAIEFKNKGKKPIKFLNFNQKIYDDHGLLIDREVQNHNQQYEPFNPKDEKFSVGYSGINKTFFMNDLSISKSFQKIEYQLISVDY